MKAKLFILGGRDVGRSFEIGERAVLGRDPGCEVRLRDRSISRKHAVVQRDGDTWIVEDLRSRNGLFVGDRRVPSAELADHDEFVLGDLPIRFRLPGAEPAPPPLVPAAGEPAAAVAELGEEIELEEEIHLEDAPEGDLADTVARERPGPATRRPVRLEPEPALTVSPPSDLERRRAELLRADRGSGLLRGDLAQQPLWVRAVIGVLVLAMVVGLSFLAYRMVQSMRGSL